MLLIGGHSDRVDTGASHADSLHLERDAAWDRATSARDTILMMIGRDWIDPPPTSWADLPQIGLAVNTHGATVLVDETGTEEGRLKNRRVRLEVCRFLP